MNGKIVLILIMILPIIIGEFIVMSNLPNQVEITTTPTKLKVVERIDTSEIILYSTTEPILSQAERCYKDNFLKSPNCLDFTYDGVNGVVEIDLSKELIQKMYRVTIPKFMFIESTLPFEIVDENENQIKVRIMLPEGETTVRIEGETFSQNTIVKSIMLPVFLWAPMLGVVFFIMWFIERLKNHIKIKN